MQKSQFKQFSSWREQTVVCSPGVTDVDFIDSKPNQFIIQNITSTKIFIGISKIPSDKNYELCVEKNSTETWGRPTPTGKLFVYNPTNTEVSIKVFSVFNEFDMNVLKSLRVAFESVEVSTDGVVKAFGENVSLPSGENKLGKVEVTNLDDVTQELLNQYEVDGKVNLKTLLKGIENTVQAIEVMTSKIENLEVSIKDTGSGDATRIETLSSYSGLQTVGVNGLTVGDGSQVIFDKLMISNVSDIDTIVKLYYSTTDYIELNIPGKDYVSNITLPLLKVEVSSQEECQVSLLGYTFSSRDEISYLNGTYSVDGTLTIGDGNKSIYSYIEFINVISSEDMEVKLYYGEDDYILLSVGGGCYVSEVQMDVTKIDFIGTGTVSLFGK